MSTSFETTETTTLHGFERRLLEEILAVAAERCVASPRYRRVPRRSLAGAATAVAAVAALALVPVLGDDVRPPGPLGVVAPEAASAAQVRARTLAALAAQDEVVVHAVQLTTTPEGTTRAEMWFDEAHPDRFRSLTFDDAGNPAVGMAMRGGKTRIIDFGAGTWSESGSVEPRPASGRSIADEMRELLDEGRMTLGRTGTVEGRRAILLAHDEPGMNRRFWIDAETYLPIETTAHWAPDERYVIRYEWLERTPATEALLWPDPPAGSSRDDAQVKPDKGKS